MRSIEKVVVVSIQNVKEKEETKTHHAKEKSTNTQIIKALYTKRWWAQ